MGQDIAKDIGSYPAQMLVLAAADRLERGSHYCDVAHLQSSGAAKLTSGESGGRAPAPVTSRLQAAVAAHGQTQQRIQKLFNCAATLMSRQLRDVVERSLR